VTPAKDKRQAKKKKRWAGKFPASQNYSIDPEKKTILTQKIGRAFPRLTYKTHIIKISPSLPGISKINDFALI
jgi:hypothetical protein